jgi:hypothetical protein
MKNTTFVFGSLFGLALLGPLLAGCFGDDSNAASCNEGTLRCACYPNSPGNNGLCQTGLVCLSNVCVAMTVTTSPEASTASDATVGDGPHVSVEAGSTSDTSTGADSSPSGDGSQTMPESGSSGTNLVTNGDFSMSTPGNDYWGIVAGNGTITVSGGMGCVAVPAGQMATLGWPEAPNTMGASLTGSASYTLSYKAFSMMGGNVLVDAKVGQTTGQYVADFETQMNDGDPVTTTPTTFTHMFTPPNGDDPSAGIAFMIPQSGSAAAATTVCFEDVGLVQN